MTADRTDTEQLLERASAGDAAAREELLQRHRQRLRRMVAVRLDPRLDARLDASDVVQETLADAARRMDAYLRERPMPYYPWLRRLACDRLAALHRLHVRAGMRAVEREEPPLPQSSVLQLAERLIARDSSPSARLHRREQRDRVQAALTTLPERAREVLVLHLEGLDSKDMAAILSISVGAVQGRHLRALKQMREILGLQFGESESW